MDGHLHQSTHEVFIETVKGLDKINVEYSVILGTILALLRDVPIFPWDHDTDIMMEEPGDVHAFMEQFESVMVEHGMSVLCGMHWGDNLGGVRKCETA